MNVYAHTAPVEPRSPQEEVHRWEVALPCPSLARRLETLLKADGFRVYRSFDLSTALAQLPECRCPHHGSAQCTCQYAVILVYGEAEEPARLLLHGREKTTWVTLDAVNHQQAVALMTCLQPLLQEHGARP